MKKIVKSIALAIAVSACATNAMAQGWLDKVSKGLDKASKTLENVTGSKQQDSDAAAQDSVPSLQDFSKNLPEYEFIPIIELDDNGQPILTEEGTPKYRVLIKNKKGDELLSKEVTKKHINASLVAGGKILLKVGVGAAGGALLGKKVGGKKGALWGGLAGAAVGGALAAKDIKAVKTQLTTLNAFKKNLAEYEAGFDNEGNPINKEASEAFLKKMNLPLDNATRMATAKILNGLTTSEGKAPQDPGEDAADAAMKSLLG